MVAKQVDHLASAFMSRKSEVTKSVKNSHIQRFWPLKMWTAFLNMTKYSPSIDMKQNKFAGF